VLDTLSALSRHGKIDPSLTPEDLFSNYVAAIARGISKVMAKMGISTLHSYKVCCVIYLIGVSVLLMRIIIIIIL